jgi:exodeoxyribonuclease V gamma subunit
MNDGDFPRRASQTDIDLLEQPGLARPGDRSRRDDDRYLMLEAVLAARDKLYVSWVGRNVRDNSAQPPSVLVSQLRDYLAAGWKMKVDSLTTEHPLQPFSRRYFEADGLPTYAAEWRVAHTSRDVQAGALPPFELDAGATLRLRELADFLRQPVRHFFRRRLGVVFGETAQLGDDDEPFALDALERYFLEDELLDDSAEPEPIEEVRARLTERARKLAREGVLPIGLVGQHWEERLVQELVPVRSAWLDLGAQFPAPAPKLAVSLDFGSIRMEDWIDKLRSGSGGVAWLMQSSSKALSASQGMRVDKLAWAWLRQLGAAAAGTPVTGYLVARDAVLCMAPLEPSSARAALEDLVALWRRNLDAPLPVACKTAFALLREEPPAAVYDGSHDVAGEGTDLCLARLWPEFADLAAVAEWRDTAEALYRPLLDWAREHVQVRPIGGEEP